MLLDLVATVTVGIGLVGVLLILRHLFGDRIPRAATPFIAGGGMLLFLVWNEASWYGRSVDALPQGVEVLAAPRLRSNLRPWSYLWPVREQYIAIDTQRILHHDQQPSLRLSELVFFGRFTPGRKLPVVVRCPEGAWAEAADDVQFDADGNLAGVSWRAAEVEPAPGRIVCAH